MTHSAAPLSHTETPVQRLIRQLSHGGLLPFVGLCLLAWLVNDTALPYVALAMVAYAALIASFLGGLHWAVVWLAEVGALQPKLPDDVARHHLIWGVMPSLLAWPGVLMPAYAALPWLGCVLVGCYLMDRKLYPAASLGHWLTLRFRLSVAAAFCCFLAAGAV